MIVATAGHIDHGKTLLVRTITGVDTDRLPEEKARGISIDLGFAYGSPGGGPLIGFVDVPGHERFVRNMVAGVCGIDFALVVVAADDGVMPQTVEHVQILDLLQVRAGLVVMTKIDRADAARRAQVRGQIDALLAGTTLAGLRTVEASPLTGEGMDAVVSALCAAAGATPERWQPGHHFRFAVDRAFTIDGSGTVVTGTVFSGEAAIGDRLLASPGGLAARVRRLRVHAQEVERVRAGDRCAINLAGMSLEDVSRGDWIVTAAVHRPSSRLDVALRLLPGAQLPGPAARVHLHHGCRHVMARVVPIAAAPASGPGGPGLARLIVDEPLPALHGDRFIVRDPTAQRTLGGGVVLDPFTRVRGGRAQRLATLEALARPGVGQALAGLLESPAGVDLDRFELMFNLAPPATQALLDALGVVVIGRQPRIGITRERHALWERATHACLEAFHAQHPAVTGMRIKELRDRVEPSLALPAFEALLHAGSLSRRVAMRNGVARLAEHDVAANPADRALWEAVYPLLRGAGGSIASALPRTQELAQAARVDPRALAEMLYRRRAAGMVHRVGADRFCLRTTLSALATTAGAVARSSPDGSFTVAQFRDAIGTGRGLAIEILECLDGVGATRRVGEVRRMRDEHLHLLEDPPAAAPACAR
ncbi:selenocysteine-specific translation elongation factor [Ramlibacter sp. AW1]|uniref:Selenocysteine-specific elongation factor n=1 Tax=Ramlibacter aurantiacus TaxID=2801330 RepID=A0A937D1K4_9BURK|nr:selenocysteine-specific translation elongation factor [Ramlibacter aurantiacus]MBL0420619.1 selenocysteine-specific translation elongation factor [Ramlibacter aurantiacus]